VPAAVLFQVAEAENVPDKYSPSGLPLVIMCSGTSNITSSQALSSGKSSCASSTLCHGPEVDLAIKEEEICMAD